MSYGEDRNKAIFIEKIIRVTLLFLVIAFAIIASGTEDQWVKLRGENTIARIWFSASLSITLIFTVWLNYKISKDKRLNKEYLIENHKGFLTLNNTAILVYTVLFIVLILSGFIDNTIMLTFLGGPALVFLVYLFDKRVLEMEKIIQQTENQLQDNDLKELEKARAVVYHIDLPILVGVSVTTIACILLTSIEQNYPSFLSGFAAGATGMQIIVGNIAFEFINV